MCNYLAIFSVAYLRIYCNSFFQGGGENLIDKIKQLAKERGLTISQVEKECNIGKKSIYNWDDNNPSVDKVKRVADFFGTTVDELIKEEGE